MCDSFCEAPDRQHSNRTDNHPIDCLLNSTDPIDHSIQPRSYRSLNSTDPIDHSIQPILSITRPNRSCRSFNPTDPTDHPSQTESIKDSIFNQHTQSVPYSSNNLNQVPQSIIFIQPLCHHDPKGTSSNWSTIYSAQLGKLSTNQIHNSGYRQLINHRSPY